MGETQPSSEAVGTARQAEARKNLASAIWTGLTKIGAVNESTLKILWRKFTGLGGTQEELESYKPADPDESPTAQT